MLDLSAFMRTLLPKMNPKMTTKWHSMVVKAEDSRLGDVWQFCA
jgi:hypothetical protein